MKIFLVLVIAASSVFFFACEDEAIPVPLPPPLPDFGVPAAETESKEESKEAAEPKSVEALKPRTPVQGDVAQQNHGSYVIQIAVFPNKSLANALIKKLAKDGVNAYSAEVQDPDPEKGVIGTYYRVRIGFFDGKSVAEDFAKTKLEPLGYAWWVDKRKNDNTSAAASGSTWLSASEPAPQPAPEPVFEPAFEPAPEPVFEPAFESAPQPAPEPAIEPVSQTVPEPISEQAAKDAERAAAIAAAKEEYKAIAKAATATAAPKASPPPPPPPPPKAAPKLEVDNRGKVKIKSKR